MHDYRNWITASQSAPGGSGRNDRVAVAWQSNGGNSETTGNVITGEQPLVYTNGASRAKADSKSRQP